MNVTYLIPYAGNRMVKRTPGPTHILKLEDVSGSRTYCGLVVQSGRNAYSQKSRPGKDDAVCAVCVANARAVPHPR